MCSEFVLEYQQERVAFLFGGELEYATAEFAEDRDRVAAAPRGKRFSNRAVYTLLQPVTAVVIVPYAPGGRRWLGRDVADDAHEALFRELDRPRAHVLVVRTSSDRVTFWLTAAAEHKAPGASVYVLDRTGAHRVSDWRAAA